MEQLKKIPNEINIWQPNLAAIMWKLFWKIPNHKTEITWNMWNSHISQCAVPQYPMGTNDRLASLHAVGSGVILLKGLSEEPNEMPFSFEKKKKKKHAWRNTSQSCTLCWSCICTLHCSPWNLQGKVLALSKSRTGVTFPALIDAQCNDWQLGNFGVCCKCAFIPHLCLLKRYIFPKFVVLIVVCAVVRKYPLVCRWEMFCLVDRGDDSQLYPLAPQKRTNTPGQCSFSRVSLWCALQTETSFFFFMATLWKFFCLESQNVSDKSVQTQKTAVLMHAVCCEVMRARKLWFPAFHHTSVWILVWFCQSDWCCLKSSLIKMHSLLKSSQKFKLLGQPRQLTILRQSTNVSVQGKSLRQNLSLTCLFGQIPVFQHCSMFQSGLASGIMLVARFYCLWLVAEQSVTGAQSCSTLLPDIRTPTWISSVDKTIKKRWGIFLFWWLLLARFYFSNLRSVKLRFLFAFCFFSASSSTLVSQPSVKHFRIEHK